MTSPLALCCRHRPKGRLGLQVHLLHWRFMLRQSEESQQFPLHLHPKQCCQHEDRVPTELQPAHDCDYVQCQEGRSTVACLPHHLMLLTSAHLCHKR